MDLKEYVAQQDGSFREHSPTLARIAKKAGKSPTFLYRVALGHKTASPRLAADIEHLTGGAVDRRTTLPGFPWDAPIPRRKAS